jgi:hypothetical protein
MRVREILLNGGWANPVTQNTHITPALVEIVVKVLHQFVNGLNQHLEAKNMPPVELGNPCGSTTYYKRDLQQNPEREYGDIDINFLIPRIEGTTNNANADIIKKEIAEYCEKTSNVQTANGTNVILQIGSDYVQVDLVMSYSHNKAWTATLAPEYNVKGVLCNSLYSSLGEALRMSIGGGHGVQVKTQGGKLVPFRTIKGVDLQTVTNDPQTWALDIAKYFDCKKIAPRLKEYPGMLDEIRTADIVNSIKGIAETLALNGQADSNSLLTQIKSIYLDKIDKVINSPKFDKAATPAAVQKAEQTKEILASKSQQIASLFDSRDEITESSEENFSGIIPDINYLPTENIEPNEDMRTQTQNVKYYLIDHPEQTKEDWARYFLNVKKGKPTYKPIPVIWAGHEGWRFRIFDGHHRLLACQILGLPLRVTIEAMLVNPDWITNLKSGLIESGFNYKTGKQK